MSRNIFVLSLIIGAIFIAYFFKGSRYILFIDWIFIYTLFSLRLQYLKVNTRQILLTFILGPLTFLLGHQSDWWWRMWKKD